MKFKYHPPLKGAKTKKKKKKKKKRERDNMRLEHLVSG